jgi:hypothetical protein
MKDESLLAVLLITVVLITSSVVPALSLVHGDVIQNLGGCGSQGSCGGGCESSSSCRLDPSKCGGTAGGCGTTATGALCTLNSVNSRSTVNPGLLTDEFGYGNIPESGILESQVLTKASLGCGPGDNSGCSHAATGCGPPTQCYETFAKPRTQVSFSTSKKEMILGEQVTLDLNITSLVKTDCTEFQLVLSDGSSYLPLTQAFRVISGTTQWRAMFAVGETKAFHLVLEAVKGGAWDLVARVSSSNGPGDVVNALKDAMIGVGVTLGTVTNQSQNTTATQIVAPQNHVDQSVSTLSLQSQSSLIGTDANSGTVTIYGWSGTYECKCGGDAEWNFTRGDAGCDCGGAGGGYCTGNNCAGASRHYHYLHYEKIQLWDENGCSCWWIFCFCTYCDRSGHGPHDCTDRKLATTYTDANGYFQFTNIPNRDGSGNLNSYQLRFYMIGRQNCGCDPCGVDTNHSCSCGCFTILHVEGDASSPDITRSNWAWGYIGGVSDGTDYNCGAWVHYDSRWSNLYYHVTKAYDWMLASATSFSIHTVSIMWGNHDQGSYTDCAGSIWIHDSDAMDGDVVTHEYGHNVMYHFYGNKMAMGNCNVAPDGCATCGCFNHGGAGNACSCDGIDEGWADFFACLIPEESSRNWAIDRYCTKGHHYPGDLYILIRDAEDNTIVDFRDELTTQRILWDLIDGQNDGETIQLDFNTYIWSVMSGYSTSDNHGSNPPADPRTLRDFWNFFIQRFPTQKTYICRAYNMHGITNYCNGVNCGCGCVYGTRQCQNCRANACGGVGCSVYLCQNSGCSGTTYCSKTSGCYGVYCACNRSYCNNAWCPAGGCSGGGGGCPYVSTWDGSEYVLDNNLLAASERSGGADVTDYYKLQQVLAQEQSGTYSLLLSEFENEHSFLDKVGLVALDHQSNVKVAVSPYGEILTYTNPYPPKTAVDENRQNVKNLISSIDGNYYQGHNGSYVILNFGNIDVSHGAKLVLRTDWIVVKMSIHIQVQDASGNWNDVGVVIPRIHWATDIINMSGHLPDARGNMKVRLYFTADHKVDFVGLDTSPQATVIVQTGQLVSAIHSTGGDVTGKLLAIDQTYAEMIPGQQIRLEFSLPAQMMKARDYIFIATGHYYTIKNASSSLDLQSSSIAGNLNSQPNLPLGCLDNTSKTAVATSYQAARMSKYDSESY